MVTLWPCHVINVPSSNSALLVHVIEPGSAIIVPQYSNKTKNVIFVSVTNCIMVASCSRTRTCTEFFLLRQLTTCKFFNDHSVHGQYLQLCLPIVYKSVPVCLERWFQRPHFYSIWYVGTTFVQCFVYCIYSYTMTSQSTAEKSLLHLLGTPQASMYT